ncbi:MAG: nucleotidyltransferase family protein [Clostridia bacterium]|nr:nucleotidyltransferase family protein [Clostridia bacterium]
MSTVGIIAEFNPLHNGHKYLINEAKKYGKVVCVISSNFVQRGDTAIYDKYIRAKSALLCGADLVAELPVCYSMSTTQNFALGGVSVLWALGCDTLMFGSECGDIESLIKTAEVLKSPQFEAKLPKYLQKGITFAKARQLAAEECGAPKDILNGANNNLAVEYITAAKNINANISFKTVKRLGAMHDSATVTQKFASASTLRGKIKQGALQEYKNLIPCEVFPLFEGSDYSDISRLDTAILSSLRSKPQSFFKDLPDLSEGVENKLYSAIKTAKSLDELYANIKVKRYTLARIRRLVLSAYLEIGNRLFLKTPPYLRVLGFTKGGENILKQTAPLSPIPIVLRVSEIENLSSDAKYMFETECRASDLYGLSFNTPKDCSTEYTQAIIKF